MRRRWIQFGLALGLAIALAVIVMVFRPSSQLETEEWEITNLHQGKAIVTGQRDETRLPGFERALADVLKKVSGDATVVAPHVADIRSFVTRYSETDRLAEFPIHDEQGTRDRPFDLLVDFNAAKVDALLASLGRKPWETSRPEVLVLAVVELDSQRYIVTSDDEQGLDQRDALVATAWAAGIPMALPTASGLLDTQLTPGGLMDHDARFWASRFSRSHVLMGSITWRNGMKGWEAHWQFSDGTQSPRWQILDVNFSDATRSAMRGVAHILSGQGKLEGMIP